MAHPNDRPIYKILTREQWRFLADKGRTDGAPIDVTDGFVHFSTADQLAETAARHFGDLDDLLLLACNPSKMGDALRWEPSRGGALFPHLYGKLSLDYRLWITGMTLDHKGRHRFPDPLPGASTV